MLGTTIEDYFSAVVNREIAWIRKFGHRTLRDAPLLSERLQTTPEMHIRLLQQFLSIVPHILPPEKDVAHPTLWHHDLHSHNIFVDDIDPTKISGIIDWQAVWAAPLFMQARFPSVFDCDGPYPWCAVEPKLPEEFDTLSEADKEEADNRLSEVRLKFYEVASRKFNPYSMRADH